MLRTGWFFLGSLAAAVLACLPLRAAPLGAADGGFESGFAGMVVSGNADIAGRLGILGAAQGARAALLNTAPDAGSEPADATVSSVTVPGVPLPPGAARLRFHAVFLTDEPTPSLANDRLTVTLRNQRTLAETVFRVLDTFGPAYPAPWTGYGAMSGWRSLDLDLSGLAGGPDLFAVEFRIQDVGDGRRNSAVLLDDVRTAAAGAPRADAGFDYLETTAGTPISFNGLASADDGSLTEYRWAFGDGSTAAGPAVSYAYSRGGVYQGSLTVVDDQGNQDTDLFTVVVGGSNRAPVIGSDPVTVAVELRQYRYDVDATDPESLFGDTVTFSLVTGPAGMAIDPVSGLLTWRPTALSPRTNPVTVRATDSQGLSATQSFTVTVVEPTAFIVVTDDAGNVYAADSNGDGTWARWRWVTCIGGTVRGAAIADFTGDGAMDFVTGSVYSGSTLTLFLFVNDGTNTFRNAGPVLTADGMGWAYGMAEGDFNRDGAMDLAVCGDSANLLLAFGNGRGAFTGRVIATGRGNGRGLDAADVDHDGDLDLVRGTSDSREFLWRNDGRGGFTVSTQIASLRDPYAVVLGDFDGDGNSDLIAADTSTGDAFLYSGQGDGTFAAGMPVPALDFNNHGSFDNFDFNGDGTDDIVAVTYSTRQVYFYAGNGDGTFRPAVRINPSDMANNCLGIAAPPGPAPVGAPLAVIDPNPAYDVPGAVITFSAAGSVLAADAPWWDAAWGRRQALLVNNQGRPARAGARIRVRVPWAAGMAPDFADLRAVDASGGLVSYWIESRTDGVEAFVWLRLPLLRADAFDSFFVYFGNPLAVSLSDQAAVFGDPLRSTGADGALEVTGPATTVNPCTWLTDTVPAGGTVLPVGDGTGFADGDTVLVIQMQNGADGEAGVHEFGVIAAGGGTPALTLAAPLANTYRSGLFDAAEAWAAQVVRVPNYTDVVVRAGASLAAPAWDGRRGGVLAFVAQGTVTVEAGGAISASGAGFRGTAPRPAIYRNATGQQGESALGRGTQSFAANGSGGGGGEGRQDAGGGGGGGYGMPGAAGANSGGHSGGAGGRQAGSIGLGVLLPGGGGGEGGADEDGGRPGNGGSGGGIVLIRASRLAIDGSVSSNGAAGGNGSNDVGGGGCGMGGGGGGAGGSVYLDAVVSGSGSLSAVGGNGGSNNGCGGAGGAGGHGRIYINGNGFDLASTPPAAGLGAALFRPQDYGAAAAYEWDFGGGATASGVTAVHAFPDAEGDYPVLLTVTDPMGRSDSEIGLVRLRGAPPVADAGGPYVFDERYAVGGVWTVPLDGSGSSDDSGGPLVYAWRLGNNLNETFDALGPDGMPLPGLWAWSPEGVAVAAGAVRIAGTGAWGNRYLGTLVQYPRAVGQSFRCRVLSAGASQTMWGLKSANDDFSYGQLYYAFYFDNGTLRIYEGGNNRGSVAGYSYDVSYDVRLDVDYFGARYYLRQSGQPAWTLLYESGYSSASPLRCAVTVYSGTFVVDDWTVSDSESSLARPTVTYPREGTYTVWLTVTDPVLQEDTAGTTVSLVHGAPPTADPGGPYLIPETAADCGRWTLTFDGSGSFDPEGALRTDGLDGIYRYVWDFGDGTRGTGKTPTHTYPAGGVYTVTLTVWDHALLTGSAATTVTTVPGAPPVADAGGPYAVDEHAANAGIWTVPLSAAGSADDVGLCDYTWDFGDGAAGAGVAPSHGYAAPGVYTVTVTARDHALQEHQASSTVTVRLNDPPVPDAGGPYVFDETAARNGLWNAAFDGSGSTDDVGIWTYDWDFGELSALAFDGGGADGVTVPDAEALRPAQLTVAAWVCPTAFPSWGAVLMKSSTSSWADGYGIVHTNGADDLRFFVNGYAGTYVQTSLAAGSWVFVAGTFDGALLRLYVNGDLVDERSAAPIVHSAGVLEIGNASGGDYPWQGWIDDVSLWNRALTSAEIRQLTLAPPDPAAGDLVAFWDFADGTGADRTGHGHDGTLAGDAAPLRATGTGVAPAYVFTHPGTHPVALTVTDHGRQAVQAFTEVTVRGNGVPVADAGPALVTEAGMPVRLDAGASSDDLGIWRTCWEFDAPKGWDTGRAALEQGAFVVAGTGNWGDRYAVAAEGFPRVPGASFTGRIGVARNGGSNRYVMWGLKDTSIGFSYTAFTYAIYFNNGNLNVYEQGSDRGRVGTYSEGRFYEARIDLKAQGATYYVRPEGAATWTRVYDSAFSNAAPLRPGFTVHSGIAVASDFAGPGGPLAMPPALRRTDTAVEVVYSRPGVYHPTVTVTDHAWQFDTAATEVTVVAGSPPVADNGGPYLTNEMVPTRLNARRSRDDFGIRWYDWEFGDGQSQRTRNPWVDHVYAEAGTYLLTLTVTDYAGHTAVDTSSVNVIAAPVVACVPWQIRGGIEVPHDTLSGRRVLLKGVCWTRNTPVNYTWDFGDGSPQESGTAADPYTIEARHVYTGVEGTPFIARLTVTDAAGRTASDNYLIRIRPPSIDVEINMANDDGLWWLHGRLRRGTFAAGTYAGTAVPYGYWTNANGYNGDHYKVSPTASALQGFLVNGHRETGDVRQDPYVETVGRGLCFLTASLRPIAIGPQTYGDPDTNGNTIGIETNLDSDQRAPYEVGQAMDALVASGLPGTFAVTGPPMLQGRTYLGIVTDMADAYFWGQSDYTNAVGGGWRYSWNSDVDNSAAQWGAIGIIAAEQIFGVRVPQWVRDRNDVWLTYSYDGTGFGYTGRGNGDCTTPSGMVQLAFVGACAHDDPSTPEDDRDPRWRTAENYIAGRWNDAWWYPNSRNDYRFSYYGYYAFTKAMRTARPRPVERLASTGLDWFKDDTRGIARRLISRQMDNGSWPRDTYGGASSHVGDDLSTAWSVVMLSPTLFVQPPVADAGENRVWGVDVPLRLDGSRSYHMDPFRSIVLYEWDLDEDGVYDAGSATDPTLRVTYTPEGLLINGLPGGSAGASYPLESLPRDIVVSLRVTDNNDPAITDVDTVTITLAVPPRPPVANAGGPYQARLGVPILLDGSGSFDIDPTDFITEWQWDTDGNLTYGDASGEKVWAIFTAVGVYNIGLRVLDNAVMNDVNENGVQDPEERLEAFDFTTVTVVTNSAPLLDRSARLRFTPITEDTADPAGDTVAAVLAGDPDVPVPLTDPDDDPVGIAVTGLASTGPGVWQFRVDEEDDWVPFGDVSPAAATLLPAGARVRFVPELSYNNGQTGTLTFQGWDRTRGAPGETGVDVTAAGGDTPFSLASDTVELAVLPVNDAPRLDPGGDLALTPCGVPDPPGDTVAAILGSAPGGAPHPITDPDEGALEGIAVIGLTGTTLGVWQYRRPGDSAWSGFGAVRETSATLLAPDARIRFLPGPEFYGTSVSIFFRAWDQTLGSDGDTGVDTSANGGTTPFSVAVEEAVLAGPTRPDLVVDGVETALLVTGCTTLEAAGTLTATIRNAGGSATPAEVSVLFFEDRDGTGLYEPEADVVLGTGTLPAGLAPGAVAPVAAPAAGMVLFAGNRVFALADAEEAVAESDEANNLGHSGAACEIPGTLPEERGPREDGMLPAPDLTASYLRAEVTHRPPEIRLTARVGNGGAAPAPAPVEVAFYNGDPDAGGVLLGIAATSAALEPGAFEDVSLLAPPAFVGPQTLVVRADDAGQGAGRVEECDETNNRCEARFDLVLNRAPVLDPAAALVLSPITEDTADPAGDEVQAVLASDPDLTVPITDADGDPPGIAVIGLGQPCFGTWQYALAGGPWTDIGPVSVASALLLDAGARLRFVPELPYNNGQTLEVTFRAWDGTAGLAGQAGVDASVAGGYTPFSTQTDTALLEVRDVNDAPVLDPSPSLQAPAVTAGTPDPGGFTVLSVLTSAGAPDGIADPDFGALEGIAILSLDSLPGGRWQVLLPGAESWADTPPVNSAAALLLPVDALLRFVPPERLSGDRTLTARFRAWDQTTGTPGTLADTTPNGGTTAFSTAEETFLLTVLRSGTADENWWYPAFTWEALPLPGASRGLYEWYHVQVFPEGNLARPCYEANVRGTTMTNQEYFLAAFDGFPEGTWLWRYRGWDPATDSYGPFVPASLAGTVDPAYQLELQYGRAAPPTALGVANTAPGIWLLSFLVANARGYEVRIVRDGDGAVRAWTHAFIPGEDPAKATGDPADFGRDNPPMDPPLIPRDQPATLAVNLTEPGVYRVLVRGFNPTDERDGLPPFTEFPEPVTVAAPQPAWTPPPATGMIPGGTDLIAIPGSGSLMPHRLQWDPVPGAQRFVVYLAAANATPVMNFEDVGSATRVEVALAPGSYTWQVVGLNEEGAVPAAGAWSEAQHFEVVSNLVRPAMADGVERLDATHLRIHWALGGAVPELVSVRHLYRGRRRWNSYAPQTLMDVDEAGRTGVLELADLARTGPHYVLLRGYVRGAGGELLAGEPRLFPVPALPGRREGRAGQGR